MAPEVAKKQANRKEKQPEKIESFDL